MFYNEEDKPLKWIGAEICGLEILAHLDLVRDYSQL